MQPFTPAPPHKSSDVTGKGHDTVPDFRAGSTPPRSVSVLGATLRGGGGRALQTGLTDANADLNLNIRPTFETDVIESEDQPVITLPLGAGKKIFSAVAGLLGGLALAFSINSSIRAGFLFDAPFNLKLVTVGLMLFTTAIGVVALNFVQSVGISSFSNPVACAVKCNGPMCEGIVKRARGAIAKLQFDTDGRNMWTVITTNLKLRHGCLLTPWSISHLLCYIVIGFAVPSLWYITFGLSMAWEIFEYYTGCHDWIDPFVNALALVIGVSLRYMLYPRA
jgi:hypothetical protein